MCVCSSDEGIDDDVKGAGGRAAAAAATGDAKYVIVVEHDLAVLDYLSDFICVLYGQPGAYGELPLGVVFADGCP